MLIQDMRIENPRRDPVWLKVYLHHNISAEEGSKVFLTTDLDPYMWLRLVGWKFFFFFGKIDFDSWTAAIIFMFEMCVRG